MQWLHYIAVAAIALQLLFLYNAYRNYRYVLAKQKRRIGVFTPRAALIVPCKGLDADFDRNIASFFAQDYDDYILCFVVGDASDPAYAALTELKARRAADSKAKAVRILVAGTATSSSQKVHNLLHCYRTIGDDVEVMAFADSDACVQTDWLRRLVWPLRLEKHGASTGYRWFVPNTNTIPTLALSALNAAVAQMLGNTPLNLIWGGSMAITVRNFRRFGLDKAWQTALSDDLSVSRAVKTAGKKVVFVPPCLVASYETTTWAKLFEFARRQFVITRVVTPGTWLAGLLCSLGSVLGLWGGVALAVYTAYAGLERQWLFVAVPVVFFAGQFVRAALRQHMIAQVLKNDLPRMKYAKLADLLGFWIWSILLLCILVSSAFGRTIRWRGIRYRLLGPTETVVEGPEK